MRRSVEPFNTGRSSPIPQPPAATHPNATNPWAGCQTRAPRSPAGHGGKRVSRLPGVPGRGHQRAPRHGPMGAWEPLLGSPQDARSPRDPRDAPDADGTACRKVRIGSARTPAATATAPARRPVTAGWHSRTATLRTAEGSEVPAKCRAASPDRCTGAETTPKPSNRRTPACRTSARRPTPQPQAVDQGHGGRGTRGTARQAGQGQGMNRPGQIHRNHRNHRKPHPPWATGPGSRSALKERRRIRSSSAAATAPGLRHGMLRMPRSLPHAEHRERARATAGGSAPSSPSPPRPYGRRRPLNRSTPGL